MIDYNLTISIIFILITIVTLIIRSLIKTPSNKCNGSCGSCACHCINNIKLPKKI